MFRHGKKTVKQDAALRTRNELANMLLFIREQASSYDIKESLYNLEKQLMDFPISLSGAGTYGKELRHLINDFPLVLEKDISRITKHYLKRMKVIIVRWQQQYGMEEERKMPLDLFSRKKANEKNLAQKRQKCESDIFCLEQKYAELSMKIEKLEKEKKDLVLKAAKSDPGSHGYSMNKLRYSRIAGDLDAALSHKSLVQKALDSNYEYLNTIHASKNLLDMKGLMPPSPEEVELAVQNNISARSNMVDEFDKELDIMKFGNDQFRDKSVENTKALSSDPFDMAVSEIKEADKGYRAILGSSASLVNEMQKPAVTSDSVKAAADSIGG